jgi:hypothetical protein
MKSKKRPRKPKDLALSRNRARRVKGGAVRKATLTAPSPPSGPVPIPYPN